MSNLKRFYIYQNKEVKETHVPAALISKLYTLVNAQNLSGNSYDTENTTIIGKISTGYTYDNYIEALDVAFPDLEIEYEGLYLHFADSEVEQVILNNTNKFIPSGTTYDYEGVIDTLNLGTDGFKQIFYNNQDITTFDELPKFKNLKSIGYQDFRDCYSLRSVDLTNIESIYGSAFRSSYNLEYFNGLNSEKGSLRLPNLKSSGLKPSGNNSGNTFYCYWDDASHMYLGPKIIKIYDLGNCDIIPGNAFYACTTLEYVADEVFSKLKTIEGNAFYECGNLVVDDLNLYQCSSVGSYSFCRNDSRGTAPQIKKISGLGPSCQIGQCAFQFCDTLTTITTEALENIKSIGQGAFNGCTSLLIEDLSLPNLTSISYNAFDNTKVKTISNLGNINVVQGFRNCTMLTSVVLPSSATTLGDSAFSGCSNLQLPTNVFTQIKYFCNWCLNGVNGLPTVLSLPNVTLIGNIPFPNTNVRSIYLPKLINTNGEHGHGTPSVGRGERIFRCGANMSIFYLKDINKINGWAFGGATYSNIYTLNVNSEDKWYVASVDVVGRHYIDGNLVAEYQTCDSSGNSTPIPFNPKGYHTDQWGTSAYWSNIKYLVINRTTPPEYWQTTLYYSRLQIYGSFGLYQQNSNGSSKTFQYLAVPRSAIDAYLNWTAFHPDFSLIEDQTDKDNFIAVTKFDNNDPNNPRIISIESMGHFATKAEYDAAPDYPNGGSHHKEEYLIEEYMGLGIGETINWDPTPTWSPYGT